MLFDARLRVQGLEPGPGPWLKVLPFGAQGYRRQPTAEPQSGEPSENRRGAFDIV
jgi:hypothetical protein